MKETAFEHFQRTYVNEVSRAKLTDLEDFYRQHRDELAPEFLESLRRICLRTGAMQSSGEKTKIAYIHYAMLRTVLREKSHLWRVDAYDNSWYLDRRECETYYDAGWAFKFLDAFETELEPYLKRYLNRIGKADLERLKMREATKYQFYVIALARYALKQASALKELHEIAKETLFEIRVGEYFDISETVYKEDLRPKDPQEIKMWLEKKEPNQYSYEVFRSLDLSNGDYEGNDLRYADFNGANLSRSNLRKTMLLETKLTGATLEETDFSLADIFAADFKGCQLQGARFYEANGGNSLKETSAGLLFRFDGVDFRGANLEGADFEGADLNGADFTGANLTGVNFEEAELRGAVFSKETKDNLVLDEEQRQAVIWR
ncbi:MAG: pentapeptide repeat-containing protein [Firmicutes bacterium]|nr:pentapeptide repeat-containing protein [Bacillota bacterium]